MCAYDVTVGVMRGCEPDEIRQTTVPVIARTKLDAACLAERCVNLTLSAAEWARTKFVDQIFPPFPPLGPTAVAA